MCLLICMRLAYQESRYPSIYFELREIMYLPLCILLLSRYVFIYKAKLHAHMVCVCVVVTYNLIECEFEISSQSYLSGRDLD